MVKTMDFGDKNAIDAFTKGAPLQQQSVLIKKEKKDKTISITLRQSDLDAMNAYCEKTGMSRSNLIRLAVAKYIAL